MTYFFTGPDALETFNALSDALPAGRRPLTLPGVEFGIYELAGKVAAPRAVSGADVLPWRPALGAFLLLERGAVPPGSLVDVDGVAGIWWFEGAAVDTPISVDRRGLQLSLGFLDDDPVEVAERMAAPLAAVGGRRPGALAGRTLLRRRPLRVGPASALNRFFSLVSCPRCSARRGVAVRDAVPRSCAGIRRARAPRSGPGPGA